jgi:hypothetical protein
MTKPLAINARHARQAYSALLENSQPGYRSARIDLSMIWESERHPGLDPGSRKPRTEAGSNWIPAFAGMTFPPYGGFQCPPIFNADKLIHDYFGGDFTTVWKSVSEDLPVLEMRLRRMVAEMRDSTVT